MKLVLSLWFTELAALAIGISIMVSCRAERFTPHPIPQAPAPVRSYPNILDTMPMIAVSAMDELELIVKNEVEEKAKEFASK
jgi:hypothetical protein